MKKIFLMFSLWMVLWVDCFGQSRSFILDGVKYNLNDVVIVMLDSLPHKVKQVEKKVEKKNGNIVLNYSSNGIVVVHVCVNSQGKVISSFVKSTPNYSFNKQVRNFLDTVDITKYLDNGCHDLTIKFKKKY